MRFSNQLLEFFNDVDQFVSKNREYIWFRGHAKSEYKLISSLFRRYPANSKDDLTRLEYIETTAYISFHSKGWYLHQSEDWDLAYLMQHFGVPTRLLDWTTSLNVALWFAVHDASPEDTPHIWILNANALNHYSIGMDHIMSPIGLPYTESLRRNHPPLFEQTLAIFPKYNNSRLTVQQGCFTIQGNSSRGLPLDEEVFEKGPLPDWALHRIDIKTGLLEELQFYLKLCSTGEKFSIYPELPSLGADIVVQMDAMAHP